MFAGIRRALLLFPVAFACVAGATAQSTNAAPKYPSQLPYSFSNFVWWTDGDLRAILKRRILGLQDEIATNVAAEHKIRDALVVLMREKGITADVLVEEPSPFSVTAEREPDIPAPSISFSLLSPQILVDKVVISGAMDELSDALGKYLQPRQGRDYSSGEDWIVRSTSKLEMERKGYLEADATVSHDLPRRDGDHYVVNLLVSVKPGPQYYIADLTADGGPLLKGRDLSQFFGAKRGGLAVTDPFGRLAGQLRALYWSGGYADVEVQAPPIFDRDRALVSYHLAVLPGPIYHLRSLTVQSLSPEQESKVRELLGMKPGDVFDEMAINNLYPKLASEPLLKNYSFSFGPAKDRTSSSVDLTLKFFKSGEETMITTQ